MIDTEARDGLRLSTDPDQLDVDVIYRFIAEESYWAPGVPREVVERAIAHSLRFAVYDASAQIAFARVVTDRATGYGPKARPTTVIIVFFLAASLACLAPSS
jgi:hypothetical protein